MPVTSRNRPEGERAMGLGQPHPSHVCSPGPGPTGRGPSLPRMRPPGARRASFPSPSARPPLAPDFVPHPRKTVGTILFLTSGVRGWSPPPGRPGLAENVAWCCAASATGTSPIPLVRRNWRDASGCGAWELEKAPPPECPVRSPQWHPPRATIPPNLCAGVGEEKTRKPWSIQVGETIGDGG